MCETKNYLRRESLLMDGISKPKKTFVASFTEILVLWRKRRVSRSTSSESPQHMATIVRGFKQFAVLDLV